MAFHFRNCSIYPGFYGTLAALAFQVAGVGPGPGAGFEAKELALRVDLAKNLAVPGGRDVPDRPL